MRIDDRNPHEIEAVKAGCHCDKCPIARLSDGTVGPQDYGNVGTETNPGQPIDGIILIGEIPTFNDKRGPLSGRAKRNWQEALEKSGLNRLNLLLVPTVHCVPTTIMKKSDRVKVVHSCRPSPVARIAALPANTPLLLIGTDAIQSYGLDKKINENRGFLHKDANGRPYIITYAATTVMFGNIYMWGTFLEDLRRFRRLINGVLRPGLEPHMVKTHASRADIFTFLNHADNAKQHIACDIETTAPADNPQWGLDPTRAQLKTIAFGTSDRAVSVCWIGLDFEVKQLIANILADPAHVKIFHNGPWFDLRVLERYSMPVVNWRDTRDLRRAISSTSRLSLGYLGSLYCDIHAWKLDDDNEKRAYGDNLDDLLLYNGYDTIVTARIYQGMVGAA